MCYTHLYHNGPPLPLLFQRHNGRSVVRRSSYPRARHPLSRHLRLSMTPLHLRHFSQDELKRDHDLTEHVQGLEQGAAARRASERKQSLLQHRKMLQERWLQDEQEEQELQAQRPPWRGRSAWQRLTLTPKP